MSRIRSLLEMLGSLSGGRADFDLDDQESMVEVLKLLSPADQKKFQKLVEQVKKCQEDIEGISSSLRRDPTPSVFGSSELEKKLEEKREEQEKLASQLKELTNKASSVAQQKALLQLVDVYLEVGKGFLPLISELVKKCRPLLMLILSGSCKEGVDMWLQLDESMKPERDRLNKARASNYADRLKAYLDANFSRAEAMQLVLADIAANLGLAVAAKTSRAGAAAGKLLAK